MSKELEEQMLQEGKIGDFVMYKKAPTDSIRIAYVGIKKRTKEHTIFKIAIIWRKCGSNYRFSRECASLTWFNSVSELIDNLGGEFVELLKNPFKGFLI